MWGVGFRGYGQNERHFYDAKFAFWRRLGLGVAPRFLQKVRAQPEILTNKLELLLRREAAPAARRAKALRYLSKFRGGP